MNRGSSLRPTLVAGLMVAALGGCGGSDDGTESTEKPSSSPKPTAMESAYDSCSDLEVGNPYGKQVPASKVITGDATSLVVDGAGDEYKSAPAAFCLLGALDADAAITSLVKSTTSLMGRQTGSWSDYTATWSFHPDNGMDMTIQMSD